MFGGWSELKEELLCLLSLIVNMYGTNFNLSLYCGFGKAARQLLLGKQPSGGPNACHHLAAESMAGSYSLASVNERWRIR